MVGVEQPMANKWNSTTLVDDNFTKDDVNKALLDLLAKANTAYSNAGAQITKGQIYTQYSGTPTPASLYGGTWTNITSTIGLSGQSGIYASGSNTYGNYIQYADGTMVQWGSYSGTYTCVVTDTANQYGTTAGTVYYNTFGTNPKIFPISFVGSVPSMTAQVDTPGPIAKASSPSLTGFNSYAWSGINGLTCYLYSWQATGKWSATAVTPSTFWQCSSTYGTTASNNPTLIQSAVYASGSNANGYYVQYTDGTMECWGIISSLACGVGATATPQVTFPQPFISLPVMTANAQPMGGWTTFIVDAWVSSATTGNIVIQTTSAQTASNIMWRAIGKWSAQTVPAPTGGITVSGIYDSGSNTYGNWIRYTDGTMICWGDVQVAYTAQQANLYGSTSGNTAYGATSTLTLPQTFLSTPSFTAGGMDTNGAMTARAVNMTASTFGLTWTDISTSTVTHGVQWQAVGKWANGIQTSSNAYTVTAQATVALQAYSASLAITTNTLAPIPLVFQVGTGTYSNGGFTVATAGIYQVSVSCSQTSTGYDMYVYRNGSLITPLLAFGTANYVYSGSQLVQCNVGDIIGTGANGNITIQTATLSINKVN